MAVKPIPDGFNTVTPYLVVEGAATVLDFLVSAFDAKEIRRAMLPDGTIMNVEVKIGDSTVMMGDSKGEYKPMPCMIYLYVDDADMTYNRAIQSGATSLSEPKDEFYGDRVAGVKDCAGNHWYIGTHKEDVSAEEIQKRIDALMEK